MTATGEDHVTARGGPLWWARWRGALLDIGLATVSSLECAVEGVPFARDAGIPVAAGLVFGLLAGSVLLVRRKWPIAVVLVAIAVAPAQMGFLMSVVGLYTLSASELPRRIIATLAGMSLVGTLIVTFVRMQQGMARGEWTLGDRFVPFAAIAASLGVTAPPVLLGLYTGARRRLMESLRERADSLERELQLLAERAEERAEWARNEERTRIAREMHDVVAHRVSLMVVHAAALQAVARKDPEKAVKNAALVGDMGRQALTELREMVGVLRSGDAAVRRERVSSAPAAPLAAVGAAAAAAASRAADDAGVVEGPCLEELAELVGQSAAAGMVVNLSVEGEARLYAPAVERTAYRVVQEALTNVARHAAASRVDVELTVSGHQVRATITDDGVGFTIDDVLDSLGLAGMRERAWLVHGRLEIISRPREGTTVVLEVPG